MGEKFLKFKRRALIVRLARSLLSALAVGLFVSGLLLLLLKLEISTLNSTASVLIGAGSALVVGCAIFFLFPLGDKRLAVMLDEELSLKERVETMLEYIGEDGAMHRLQREDTERALAEASLCAVRLKHIWVYILAVVIGALMLGSSFVFEKAPEPPPEIVDEGFELSSLQAKAIEELIADIESSEMASPYRENTVEIIKGLLEVLKVTTTVREKDAAVLLAMNGILKEVDNSSYAVELMGTLWATENSNLRNLAKAINYYEWPRLDDYERFLSGYTIFRESLVSKVEEGAEGDAPEGTDPLAEDLALILYSAAVGLSDNLINIPSDEPLCAVLLRLAAAAEENEDGTRVYGLMKLSEIATELGYDFTQREIDATFTALESVLYNAVSIHKTNTGTGERAVERLALILDCDAPRFERPSFVDTSGGGSTSGDDQSGTGGAISGGTEYGSDDLVLDPYTNTYVEYGTILDRYYALMLGSVENGEYTEEERKALEKYFTILYGGFNEGEK